MFAGAFMLPLMVIRTNVHIVVLLIISVVLYLCALLLLRALTFSDLKSLVRSLRSASRF